MSDDDEHMTSVSLKRKVADTKRANKKAKLNVTEDVLEDPEEVSEQEEAEETYTAAAVEEEEAEEAEPTAAADALEEAAQETNEEDLEEVEAPEPAKSPETKKKKNGGKKAEEKKQRKKKSAKVSQHFHASLSSPKLRAHILYLFCVCVCVCVGMCSLQQRKSRKRLPDNWLRSSCARRRFSLRHCRMEDEILASSSCCNRSSRVSRLPSSCVERNGLKSQNRWMAPMAKRVQTFIGASLC